MDISPEESIPDKGLIQVALETESVDISCLKVSCLKPGINWWRLINSINFPCSMFCTTLAFERSVYPNIYLTVLAEPEINGALCFVSTIACRKVSINRDNIRCSHF